MSKPTLPDPSIDFLSWVSATPDEDERAAHARLIEGVGIPTLNERLVYLHSSAMMERRALRRETGLQYPSQGVMRSINERLAVYELETERLLDALVWHSEEWTHMSNECLVCTKDVRL